MFVGRPTLPPEASLTEVPDYLLQRSRERRAALGLGGGDAGDGGGGAVVPAADTAPAAAAAATPAPAAAPEIEKVEPPKPITPWVQAANTRKKVPVWMAPVALFIPIWLFMVVGTLEEPTRAAEGPIAAGGEIYSSCAGCHGGGGGGGVGPQLNGGEVLLTFPGIDGIFEQMAWVLNGSSVAGTPYGDPNRPGGGRVAVGNMPAQQLSPLELIEVVMYERSVHGGQSEAELEPYILWAESGALPSWEEGVFPIEIEQDFKAFLATNVEAAELYEAAGGGE